MGLKAKLKKNAVIYGIYRFFKYLIYPCKLKRAGIINQKPQASAISDTCVNGHKVIVSLTSFPGRIHVVHKVIYSLMHQTLRPNKLILWLSSEQFPNLDSDLPKELLELVPFGLTIKWLEDDIKSYKKLVPALKEYLDDIMITADDDIYYPRTWLEQLIDSYLDHPDDIHCHLVTCLKCENHEAVLCERERKNRGKASYRYKILGGSGALYPPNSLHPDVLNKDLFMMYAPTSDDLWFWAMALRNHTKIRWIRDGMEKLYYTEGSQEDTACLCSINDEGEKLFEKHLKNLTDRYGLLQFFDEG